MVLRLSDGLGHAATNELPLQEMDAVAELCATNFAAGYFGSRWDTEGQLLGAKPKCPAASTWH